IVSHFTTPLESPSPFPLNHRSTGRNNGGAMEASSSSAIAQQTWELENNIMPMETPADDSIFHYDEAGQAQFQRDKPWANDPHYFKRVKISALALLKMVVHARSGGTIEVMGLMQGKTDADSIIVMDAFALPVEGTETRVNAQADAYEYMVDYSQTNKQVSFDLIR
ncbi:cop9 signalosome complex subunit 5a-like protein, partial [Trifolium pratense]